jgi:hypothetical protein
LKARAYVERRKGRWLILSAKHGLVEPGEIVGPYNVTMHDKTAAKRRARAQRVWMKVRSRIRPGDKVVLLAGAHYRGPLMPFLQQSGCVVEVPMRGLGIGQQKAWLKRRCERLAQ